MLECLNVGMFECWNVECWNGGLGGLESLEFRVGSLEFRVWSFILSTTNY